MLPHRACGYCGARLSFDAVVRDKAPGPRGTTVETESCPECAKKRRNPKSYGTAGVIRGLTYRGFRAWLKSEKGQRFIQWKRLGPERYFPSPRSFFLARVIAIETHMQRALGAISAETARDDMRRRYLLGAYYFGTRLKQQRAPSWRG